MLREFAANMQAPSVVRESCVVALDMWEYERSQEFNFSDSVVGAGAGAGERHLGGGTGFERSIGVQA